MHKYIRDIREALGDDTVTGYSQVAKKIKELKAKTAAQNKSFTVGQRVRKVTGDYKIAGEIRSIFTKQNGEMRLVVEHFAEGGGSFLHIYGPNNLEIEP